MIAAPFRASLLLVAACLPCCERRAAPAEPVSNATVARSSSVTPIESTTPTAASLFAATVHLPTRLAAGQKAPLLVMLHGLGSSAEDIERSSDWPAFAEQHGIAWLAPNGSLDSQGRRFWDAGSSCCNFEHAPVDHVAALRALIEHTLATKPIDPARVFVGGYSNGGFMAHRLACAAPQLLRGIVSLAGSGPLEAVQCEQPTALRVLQIQGDADPIVTYEGGQLFKNPRLPEHASAQKTVADWAARLGCRQSPVSGAALDIEARLPGNETRVTRYEGCKLGQVELWTVTSGGHFIGARAPAPAAIWRFLNP
jgi:polyhydroxybutyrate depolymerase